MRKKETKKINPILLVVLLLVIVIVAIIIVVINKKNVKEDVKVYYDIGVGKVELIENNVPTVKYDAKITWEGTDKQAELSDSKTKTKIDNNYTLTKSGTYEIAVGGVTRSITVSKEENKGNMINILSKSRGQMVIAFDKSQVESAKITYADGTEENLDVNSEVTITTKGSHSIILKDNP